MPPVTVDITSLAYGGKGVGRIEGKVVFVPYTAPGDRARIEIISEKRGFLEGRLLDLILHSSLRQSPPCPLFGRCGGCHWEHIQYLAQVDWKDRIFRETIERIGRIMDLPLEPPIPAAEPFRYRVKAQFHIEDHIWGFFEAGSHRVIEVGECYLLDPVLNKTFISLRNYIEENQSGLPIHTVEIGKSNLDGRTVALIQLKKKWDIRPEVILTAVTELKGIEFRVTPPGKRTGKVMSSAGDLSLIYRLKGLVFKSGISTFSQANISQNLRLAETVLEYADIDTSDFILDLYCGAGNLTLPLAGGCSKVIGVDSEQLAIKDAISNARANSIKNVNFICSHVSRGLMSISKILPDIVILDPPREGGLDAVRGIAGLKPKRVIYVSCNPSTLARDLAVLIREGYVVNRARVIDMFPQTYHIEGVVKLQL
ncbi:MAG: 23S rRNA (uracil(1939)-C(5))-methyltransferase RlmD [Nitrospirae bacterium]|nr:23S rRNA (uracil(1939)-C(5))-methyltransferase RlmD [Nitrospirota bacterium]